MREWRRGADDREKREDAAFVIPLFGVVLLMPPLVNLFVARVEVFGIPLEIAYLFAVWLLLVVSAVGLSFLLPSTGPSIGGMEPEGDIGARPEDE